MILVKATSLLFFSLELLVLSFGLTFRMKKRKLWYLPLAGGILSCFLVSVLSAMLKDYLMSFVNIDTYDFSVFIFTYSYTAVSKLILIAIFTLTLHFVFQNSIGKSIFLMCLTYSIQNMASNFFSIILLLINPKSSPTSFTLQMLKYPFYLCLYLLIYSLFYLFGILFWKAKKEVLSSEFLHQRFIFFFISMIVINVILSSVNPPQNSLEANAVYFFVLVACFLFSILEIILQFFMAESNEKAIQKSQLERMVKEKNHQYELSKQSMEHVNMAAHDLKGQLNMILCEIEAHPEKEDFRNGIESISQSLKNFDITYHTGCEPLDITLTEKASTCQKNGICLTVMADGKALSQMESLDIYMLFGNALDNAIEAAGKIEEKEKRIIHFQLKQDLGMTHCRIENTYRDAPTFRNGVLITGKQDKDSHGYGVKSMEAITGKYHGSIKLRVTKNLFILEILLPEK